jgi:hypothetical protein
LNNETTNTIRLTKAPTTNAIPSPRSRKFINEVLESPSTLDELPFEVKYKKAENSITKTISPKPDRSASIRPLFGLLDFLKGLLVSAVLFPLNPAST